MMKLFLLPAVSELYYLDGFTRVDAPVTREIDNDLGRESYTIKIYDDITIRAADDAGFYYADITLSQIKAQCGQNIPNVLINDSPRFSYRSFMIDSSRHFFTTEEIKRMIEHCAKLKMNVFHWHITDDQGWRAEIKAFPELTQIGSIRKGSHFRFENNEDIHGGYYTVEEMKEVVEFAHARHMIVVPEFDMPGHTCALMHSIPGLACGGKEVQMRTTPGISKDILCAGSERTYEVIYKILDEMCEIFTDKYFHIGGDEAPKSQWKSCPVCQQKIKDENLKNEEELQGYFINRIGNYLKEKGKTVITWNDSLKSGNIDSDINVQMWLDLSGLSKKSSNTIINSNNTYYYVDYPYAVTPLKKAYRYDPMINKNVIGTDTPIWTENVTTIEKMEYMCFPRFMAVAQSAWCKNKPPYKEFKEAISELNNYFAIENMAKPEKWDISLKNTINKKSKK